MRTIRCMGDSPSSREPCIDIARIHVIVSRLSLVPPNSSYIRQFSNMKRFCWQCAFYAVTINALTVAVRMIITRYFIGNEIYYIGLVEECTEYAAYLHSHI